MFLSSVFSRNCVSDIWLVDEKTKIIIRDDNVGVSAANLYIIRICVYNLETRGHNSYLHKRQNKLSVTRYKYYLLILYGKTTFKFQACNKFYNGWIIYLIDNNIQHIDQRDESREKLACQEDKIAPSHCFIAMYISSHWVWSWNYICSKIQYKIPWFDHVLN